jgi:hypothetical protein
LIRRLRIDVIEAAEYGEPAEYGEAAEYGVLPRCFPSVFPAIDCNKKYLI